MRELSTTEINQVSGGSLAGNIAMGLAGGWASGVAGAGIGSVVAGPAGTIIGGVGGFVLGGAITVGYSLATSDEEDS